MTPRLAAAGFETVFGAEPELIIRAPGRVNLIGDHTDYNEGLVLPMAIDRALYVAASPIRSPRVRVYSKQFDERVELPLTADRSVTPGSWARYVFGVIAVLHDRGVKLRGCNLWIGGDVPPGGGLSSSAAVEIGVARALLAMAGESIAPGELARLCRRAENEYAGSPCGIMDQLCCTSARAGHALLIDCRSLETEAVPLRIQDARLVVVDTGVRHSIAGGQYAKRREQCARALQEIRTHHPAVRSLRDVDETLLTSMSDFLDAELLGRVRHCVSENSRVRGAAKALRNGDLEAFGRLMVASHQSLRDDYEVSCRELDDVVSIALSVDGVYGARMTGGGFGGCAIVLSERGAVGLLRSALQKEYSARHATDAANVGNVDVFVVRSADCAGPISRDGGEPGPSIERPA